MAIFSALSFNIHIVCIWFVLFWLNIALDGKTHNSIKCNRPQYWGLLAEIQKNAENTGNRDHVILQC